MYLEPKEGEHAGRARIGRVHFSSTGASLYYAGKTFQSLKGTGFKANYFEVESGQQYWISGPRKDGLDRLYPSNQEVPVDEDVQDEYWRTIRGLTPPAKKAEA